MFRKRLALLALFSAAAIFGCKGRFKPIPPGRFTLDVALGEAAGAARMKDGSVRQLGPANGAVVAELEGASAVASRERATCGVFLDGSVRCADARGAVKRMDELQDAVALAAGGASTCARTRAGAAWCWSDAGATRIAGIEGATQIAVYGARGCALFAAGTARCWGPASGPESALRDAAQIAVGAEHACAVVRDGSVRCWGKNREGQLGDGTFDDRASPVLVVGLERVAQLALGARFSCSLGRDATVRCWGENASHELADGTTDNRPAPEHISGLFEIFQIAAGDASVCARMGNGDLRCWGAVRIPGTDADLLSVPTLARW